MQSFVAGLPRWQHGWFDGHCYRAASSLEVSIRFHGSFWGHKESGLLVSESWTRWQLARPCPNPLDDGAVRQIEPDSSSLLPESPGVWWVGSYLSFWEVPATEIVINHFLRLERSTFLPPKCNLWKWEWNKLQLAGSPNLVQVTAHLILWVRFQDIKNIRLFVNRRMPYSRHQLTDSSHEF
jgi:hypothetical protein